MAGVGRVRGVTERGNMSKFVPEIITIQFDELTAALEYYRLEAGLTQEEVAERLEFNSPATISHYENGRREPSLQNIKRLAQLYGFEAHISFVRVEAAAIVSAQTKDPLGRPWPGGG